MGLENNYTSEEMFHSLNRIEAVYKLKAYYGANIDETVINQLSKFILYQLNQGLPKEKIIAHLVKEGWSWGIISAYVQAYAK